MFGTITKTAVKGTRNVQKSAEYDFVRDTLLNLEPDPETNVAVFSANIDEWFMVPEFATHNPRGEEPRDATVPELKSKICNLVSSFPESVGKRWSVKQIDKYHIAVQVVPRHLGTDNDTE